MRMGAHRSWQDVMRWNCCFYRLHLILTNVRNTPRRTSSVTGAKRGRHAPTEAEDVDDMD